MQFVDLPAGQRAASVEAAAPALERAHAELGEHVPALVES